MRLAVSHVHGLAGTRVRQGHVAFLVVGHHPLLGSGSMVVPEKLRTLDHGRPWSDDQFASTRLSSNRDMSR